MRHRRRGRHLGRSSSHRKAMMRNMVCSLFLTERDDEFYEGLYQADGKTEVKPPRHKGRIVTTLQKAKHIRPMIEKCITIAKKALPHEERASEFGTDEDRNSEGWRSWRKSDNYQKWNEAMAPAVAARRRVFSMLRDKEAVEILFDEIAPRFSDRPGGYTRIMRLATPRLGDAGTQAILELVGKNDRVKAESTKPQFVADADEDTNESSAPESEDVASEVAEDQVAADEEVADEGAADSEENGDD